MTLHHVCVASDLNNTAASLHVSVVFEAAVAILYYGLNVDACVILSGIELREPLREYVHG